MPLKTKIKSKPALQNIKIRIRRIANRNPRNLLGFQAKESKLKRIFAGFLIVVMILMLALSGRAIGKSNQLRANTLTTSSNIQSNCAAQNTAQNLVNLHTQKIKLGTRYADYAANSQWEKIGEMDIQIRDINTQITSLEQQFGEQRSNISISIARLENEVLLCADTESCATAENDLTAAQNCNQQIQKTVIALEEATKILKKYKFRDVDNNIIGKIEIQKLFVALNQYRAKTDNQQVLLQKCLIDNTFQENHCAKLKSDYEKAWEAEITQLEKIAALAAPLEAVTKELDTDITTLKFSQTNSQDFTAMQGLGWCQQSLREANTTLTTSETASENLKIIYEDALNQLAAIKVQLSAHIIEAEKKITATTTELNTVFRALTFWKIFNGIF